MKKNVLAKLLLGVLPVGMLVGCTNSTDTGSAGLPDSQKSTAVTAGPADSSASNSAKDKQEVVKPKDPAEVVLESTAPSDACANMDKLFEKFLAESPEGKAFTATNSSDMDKMHKAWSAVASEFLTQQRSKLQSIVGDDSLAKDALAALEKYVDIDGKLASGDIAEFADPAQAQDAIKLGKEPERNPRFLEASAELTQSHITLTKCLPHWPVVF